MSQRITSFPTRSWNLVCVYEVDKTNMKFFINLNDQNETKHPIKGSDNELIMMLMNCVVSAIESIVRIFFVKF